ncbi:MAG: hypothetical protein JNM84_06425 [Planctomycetes bacterium]|nr:hypothetical protein [Planctomycetota bacterium]
MTHAPLDARYVARLWLPLAASWAFMALELPLVAAIVARLPEAPLHLAAYGAAVFPVALVIEAPVIMLLAASTALVGDREAYRRVRTFMHALCAGLTLMHIAVAFTPLYDVITGGWMGLTDDVRETGRAGLQWLTPWTYAIGFRRFYQGILIRCERTRPVSIGTALRLAANASVGAIGIAIGTIPGIVVGAAAVSAGVLAEALFIGLCARRIVRERVLSIPRGEEPLSWPRFLHFYIPLALTPLLTLLLQPLGAAAMSRMPARDLSLAAWPGVHGLLFLLRSGGFAFNEVVVTLWKRPGGPAALRRFALYFALASTAILALLALTPLGSFWYGTLAGLTPELAAFSHAAILFGLAMPALQVYQSLYQGALVSRSRSKTITASHALYLLLSIAGLALSVHLSYWVGIQATLAVLSLALLFQTLLLRQRT